MQHCCFFPSDKDLYAAELHTKQYSPVTQRLTPHISAIIHHTAVPSSPHCHAPSSSRNSMMDGCYGPTWIPACVRSLYIYVIISLTEASCQLVRTEGMVLHYYCDFSTKPLGRTEGRERKRWWDKRGGGGERWRRLEIGWWREGIRGEWSCEVLSIFANSICAWICCSDAFRYRRSEETRLLNVNNCSVANQKALAPRDDVSQNDNTTESN